MANLNDLEGVLFQDRLPLPLLPDAVWDMLRGKGESHVQRPRHTTVAATAQTSAPTSVINPIRRSPTPVAPTQDMILPDCDVSETVEAGAESTQDVTIETSVNGDDSISDSLGESDNPVSSDSLNELRCWEHGCNGKVFSTRSNLLRHQIEKGQERPNFRCPLCDAYFSRTTARNQHVEKKSCGRVRRYSNGRERPRPRIKD